MPTARVRRALPADPAAVWAIVGDPRRLPEWWPRAVRVEGVSGRAFTIVLMSKRGREVRADQRLLVEERGRRRAWALEVEGTPYAEVFTSSETEVRVSPQGDGALVELELRQRLRAGASLGSLLLRRASKRQLREAMGALEAALAG